VFVYVSGKKISQTEQIPTSGLRRLEEYHPIIYTNSHQKCCRIFLTSAVIELFLVETKLPPINSNFTVSMCHTHDIILLDDRFVLNLTVSAMKWFSRCVTANSVEQSFWDANSDSAGQKCLAFFFEREEWFITVYARAGPFPGPHKFSSNPDNQFFKHSLIIIFPSTSRSAKVLRQKYT
jgi:hypothetical protein